MKYQHVADVVVEFNICATCVEGVEPQYHPSIFDTMPAKKKRSPEKFQLCNFWETEILQVLSYRTGTGIKRSGISWSKKL